MSKCNPVTYDNVTPDVFECMKKKLKDAGIYVSPGNDGDIEGSGVKAHFEWNGKSNLKITIKSKPFILSCGYVIGKIEDFLHKCQGS
jgi:hypothetical protein